MDWKSKFPASVCDEVLKMGLLCCLCVSVYLLYCIGGLYQSVVDVDQERGFRDCVTQSTLMHVLGSNFIQGRLRGVGRGLGGVKPSSYIMDQLYRLSEG